MDLGEAIIFIESFSNVEEANQALIELSQNYLDQGAGSSLSKEDLASLLVYWAKKWGQQGYRKEEIELYQLAFQWQADANIAFSLAKACNQLGLYTLALTYLEKVPELQKTYSMKLLQGQALEGLGQLRQAKDCYQTLIKAYPTEWLAYDQLAQLFEHEGYEDQAIRYYQTLYQYFLKEDSKLRRHWRKALLRLYLQQEYIDQEILQTLLKDPDLPLIEAEEFFLQGVCAYYFQDNQLALEAFQQAIELEDDYLQAYLYIVDIQHNRGEEAALKKWIQQFVKVVPSYDLVLLECLPYLTIREDYGELLYDKLMDCLPLIDEDDLKQKVILLVFNHLLAMNQTDQANDLIHQLKDQIMEADLAYYRAKLALIEGDKEAFIVNIEQAWLEGCQAEDIENLYQHYHS